MKPVPHINTIMAPVIGISRHRINTDGIGVNTLVCFGGCPLHCAYCINDFCHNTSAFKEKMMSAQELYDILKADELYFLATNSGVVFGGGEPCEYAEFISEFRSLCGPRWKLMCETSLNVCSSKIALLVPKIDFWIVDIKDINTDIYKRYAGASNENVKLNLQFLHKNRCSKNTIIRLPLIPHFNTDQDIEKSKSYLIDLGFYYFDVFPYWIPAETEMTAYDEDPFAGKRKCELLKELRRKIIQYYHLDSTIVHECPVKQCLTGNCPQCEEEARLIVEHVKKHKSVPYIDSVYSLIRRYGNISSASEILSSIDKNASRVIMVPMDTSNCEYTFKKEHKTKKFSISKIFEKLKF